MISEIEDYFLKGCGRCPRFSSPDCSALLWAQGLQDLRRICREAGLAETVKWGHPCYMHAGRNIAIIGAFRGDFRLSFFNAALMKDPAGVLAKQGENSSHPDMIRFTRAAQVTAQEPVLRSYIKEAMGYAEAGLKAPKDAREVDLPDELIEALDADPELAEAFHALTPGRKKSYALNLNSAKTAATRVSRIAGFRARILAGKGATER
ncbi:YdeI/OmpD-associated family protein [Rhodobacter sp. Har01]|uniref:YdeI/OmpD-associated family protein n=1 Tax=Rhodobacter sp. Har01 TaxID=2883999 RepID=UPI001D06BF2F|nr:YdeI/OmpD-associated family protein [Rhodobacter sp. Har01]MCB6177643.1 YdeI/OmpD-associated family protein [Rhodobacter sp. Har01]